MLCRTDRPREIVAKGIDLADRRFTPGDDLTRSRFRSRRAAHSGRFAWCACRPGKSLGPGSDLTWNVNAPPGLAGSDFKSYRGPFDAEVFVATRKYRSYLFRPSAYAATVDFRNRVRLDVAGPVVDKSAGTASRIVVPNVSLKTSDQYNTEIVEFDLSKMTFLNVPKKNVLAVVVVRRLAERARTGNGAAAVVEPIASDVPIRHVGHGNSSARADQLASRLAAPPYCRKMARSGHPGAYVRASALPPKADIVGARSVRAQKADIGCPLCPQKRT